MDDGYILIHRKIINWQWYKDENTMRLFIDLLLDANYEDSKAGFETIKRGQCLTSLKRMHERTGLTYQQIRTSLDKLKKSQEINKQVTNRYTIITIKNYDDYQKLNKQVTNNQQTSNNIKENKENKEYKESISKDILKKVFKKPLLEEIQEYCQSRNNEVDAEKFYDYYEANDWIDNNGKKVKNWKQKIITWEGRKKEKEQLPDWFDNEPKERKRTEDEERELQELIRGNKR